jgi:uncharacterized protein (UPF0303 family)
MAIKKYGTSVDDIRAKEEDESRKIVAEILDYGISQRQILYIISYLAMNLENQDHLRRIVNVVRDVKDDSVIVTKSPLEI